jgi:O-antigen/teichoic acid export membrane protein
MTPPAVVETRAAKVALASGISVALSIGLQIVSVPVCLRFWGEETYGLWLALLALANVVRTLESGFNAYVGNELNLLYHVDTPALRKTLGSAAFGAAVVGAIELLAGALIVASGALAPLLGVSEEVAREGRAGLALGLMLLGFVSTGPYLGVVNRLLIPAGMLHQGTWWFMALQIAQTASLVVAAALELTLTEAAVFFSFAQAAVHLASAVYIAHKLPDFFPWWRRPSWTKGLRDLFRSTAMVGANLLTQAGTNGVVMLVSSGLGAAAVPAFTTVRTLANLWTQLGNVLLSPLLPEVVRYHALHDARKLVAGLEAHWLIANCVVNVSILACLPFIDEAYRAWTAGRIELDRALLSTLMLAVVVGSPASLIALYLNGINDLRAVTTLYAVRGLVPLAVGIALLPSLGVVGVGIGIVLGELLGPVLAGGLHFRKQLRRLGSSAIPRWQPAALGTSSAGAFLVWQAIRGPQLGIPYGAALVGVLASIVWGWRGISPEVRDRVLRLLRRRSA